MGNKVWRAWLGASLLVVLACAGACDDGPAGDADADVDTDTDLDVDVDSDTDTDTDTDSDGDLDNDPDHGDADADADRGDAEAEPGDAEAGDGEIDADHGLPCVDGDGDGHGVGAGCAEEDCDDTDVSVFPGAVEECNGRDDDCDDAVDEESCPLGALVGIAEDRAERVASVVANAGFSTVYALTVPVVAGDVLRLRGQVEMTNDYSSPVRGHIRMLVDGAAVGSASSQNCIASGAHHMPMWSDAVVVAEGTREVLIEAQYAASRSGASPSELIEPGYGHLVVERYRRFATVEEAAAAGALVLSQVASDRAADSASFGTGGAFVRTLVYSLSIESGPGDLVRLLGQATSGYTARGLDMHGQGIFAGDARLSPWSTENTPWAIQAVPLWTDAVDRDVVGLRSYAVSMHGVLGIGGNVIDGAGHLLAMRFSPVSTADVASTHGWAESRASMGPAGDAAITANSGWQTLHETTVTAAAGDVLRVTSYLQAAHPGGVDAGISCVAQTAVLDATGAVVDASSSAPKYVTLMLEVLPLRTEVVTTLPAVGTYTLRLSFTCSREGFSPTVTLLGGRTWIMLDRFQAR